MAKTDLIILAADHTAQILLEELLKRFPKIFGLREFSWEIKVEKNRDPGCYKKGPELLSSFRNEFAKCILIFDHEGSGAEKKSTAEVEEELLHKLKQRGWANDCCVVVMEPELENWIWTNSQHTSEALGWGKDENLLNVWLASEGWITEASNKPSRPKEAMEAAVKNKLTKRITSATFQSIAAKASFRSCTSPSFIKFKDTIVDWFKE